MQEILLRGFSIHQAQKIISLNEVHLNKRYTNGNKVGSSSPMDLTDQESDCESIESVVQSAPDNNEIYNYNYNFSDDESNEIEFKPIPCLLQMECDREEQQIDIFRHNQETKVSQRRPSISTEILISLQQSKYGLCMYDLVTSETQTELFTFMEEGLSFDEAALMLFTRYKAEFKQKHGSPSGHQALFNNTKSIVNRKWSQAEIDALKETCYQKWRQEKQAPTRETHHSTNTNANTKINSGKTQPPNTHSTLHMRHIDLSIDTQKQYPSPKSSPIGSYNSKPLVLSKRNPFAGGQNGPKALNAKGGNCTGAARSPREAVLKSSVRELAKF